MSRVKWMIAGGVALALLATIAWVAARTASYRDRGPIQPAAGAASPNVALISLDTVRPDHLGAYGYAKPTSPRFDALAARGVLFRRAWTAAPWTLPSHMSVFTSMLPSHHTVDNVNKVLPASLTTLPQVLREAGYETAAVVNNGHLRGHWGFDRGFDRWQEFEAELPEGDCEHLTAAALSWLDARRGSPRGSQPFFLFMHYYDAHDPYAPPEPFRSRLGVTISGEEARRIAWEHRYPEQAIGDPATLAALIAAYDGDLAWQDHELGRLLDALPANTLIVVFSDHGEAFEEHGWTLHGASLFEEELRVALLAAYRGEAPALRAAWAANAVDAPATLLDVAPTILAACGVPIPAQFGGVDLATTARGEPAEGRLLAAETKSIAEGKHEMALVLDPWKLIYSPLRGEAELYRLPDETRDRSRDGEAILESLRGRMRAWVQEKDFWIVAAHGEAAIDFTLRPSSGAFDTFIPAGMRPEADQFEISSATDLIRWRARPGGATRLLYLELSDPAATLQLDASIDGSRDPGGVFLGRTRTHPASLPAELDLSGAVEDPWITDPLAPQETGVFVRRFRGGAARTLPAAEVKPLDRATLEQLRSLGYVQ